MSDSIHPLTLIDVGGNGGNVLFLHGYGADKLTWTGNTAAVLPHAKTFVLDLPAHGDAVVDIGDGSIATFALLVANAMDACALETVHIVGHSLGGAVALELAAVRPDLVASLSLLAPVGLGAGIDAEFLDTFPRLTTAEDVLCALYGLVENKKLISALLAPVVLDYLDRPGVRIALELIAEKLKTVDPLLVPAIDSVVEQAVPRLVIWGNEDRINPAANEILEYFGGVQHRLSGCGHLVHVEKRAAVNTLLSEFISRSSDQ